MLRRNDFRYRNDRATVYLRQNTRKLRPERMNHN